MALRAVPDHPKFADFKATLGLPKGAALGWLEAMWHFAGRFTPQGNIGKYSDQAIETWVEWNGVQGALIEAFVRTGWLDRDSNHRLLVHDWAEHADKATKNCISRNKLQFCTPAVRTEIQNGNHVHPPYPLPVPEPEPVPESVPVPEPVSANGFLNHSNKNTFDPEPRYKAYASRHPGVKTRTGDCRAAYMRYVMESTDPERVANLLDELQAKWLEYWKHTTIAPLGLLNFLAGGDCMAIPPPPPAGKKTKTDEFWEGI